MVNDVVRWASVKKKRIMHFKVDFGKAQDSISWEYLDFIINAMGFGFRWQDWIRGYLRSTR